SVLSGLVSLELLLLHSKGLRQFTLAKPFGDPRPDQGAGDVLQSGGRTDGGLSPTECFVFVQFRAQIVELAPQGVALSLTQQRMKIRGRGFFTAQRFAEFLRLRSRNPILPFIFNHRPTFANQVQRFLYAFRSPCRSGRNQERSGRWQSPSSSQEKARP